MVHYKHMHKRGFTFVELMVALALFGLVMIMALSALLSVTNSNRTAQVSREALDNIDFVLDDIVRESRLGYKYHCDINTGTVTTPRDCSPSATASSFSLTRLDGSGVVKYVLDSTGGRGKITKQVISGGSVVSDQILTADSVNISMLKFAVRGSGENDNNHAKVLVSLRVTIEDDKISRDINFQTTISQRASDN